MGYPGTIQIRNELSIMRPDSNCSRRTFSVADLIKGKISLELKTADGKLIERCKLRIIESMFCDLAVDLIDRQWLKIVGVYWS